MAVAMKSEVQRGCKRLQLFALANVSFMLSGCTAGRRARHWISRQLYPDFVIFASRRIFLDDRLPVLPIQSGQTVCLSLCVKDSILKISHSVSGWVSWWVISPLTNSTACYSHNASRMDQVDPTYKQQLRRWPLNFSLPRSLSLAKFSAGHLANQSSLKENEASSSSRLHLVFNSRSWTSHHVHHTTCLTWRHHVPRSGYAVARSSHFPPKKEIKVKRNILRRPWCHASVSGPDESSRGEGREG